MSFVQSPWPVEATSPLASATQRSIVQSVDHTSACVFRFKAAVLPPSARSQTSRPSTALAFQFPAAYRSRTTCASRAILEHRKGPTGSPHPRSQYAAMKDQFKVERRGPLFVSPVEVERFVVSPPPNPSFKRTCLRQAA
jgi:hypothetical protein